MKVKIKNTTKLYIQRCGIMFNPFEEKELDLSTGMVHMLKCRVGLKVEVINEEKTEEEVFQDNDFKLVCNKCGKEYEKEYYYLKHIEKCKEGDKDE